MFALTRPIMFIDIVKVFLPATAAFFIGIVMTPAVSGFLYRHRMWKKKGGKRDLDGAATPIYDKLHATREIRVPRLGGAVIWLSVLLTTAALWFLARLFPTDLLAKLDFLSRDQTWLPFFAFLGGAAIGLCDDLLEIRGNGGRISGGLSLRMRLSVVTLLALAAAFWFYLKLDVDSIGIPFWGDLHLGWLFIPLFVIVTVAVYSGGIIDGIDGLAGGIFAIIFGAYAGIAFYQDQINLAAFSAVVVGGTLAFLWFNIPPARFFMSETGTMGLTLSLAIVAFMTDSLGEGHGLIVLPIIAFPLAATTFSAILQVASKKLFGRKLFRVAPLHHHFEALGWPPEKVTMRYWVIGIIVALIGMIVGFIG